MPTVPKYERTQVTPQPTPAMRATDLSQEVTAIGKAEAAPLDIASQVIQDEVRRGKQMAVENYKLQVARAHAELQDKVLNKQRKDAIAGADEVMNDWTKVESDLTGGIAMNDVRDEVLQYANQKKVELAATAARHAKTETQRMATEDYQAGINLAINNAVVNADSEPHTDIIRDEIIASTSKFAESMGIRTDGTPEETATFRGLVTDKLTMFHAGLIEQLADSGNIEGAKYAFERAKRDPELNAKAILALNDKLKASERKHEDETFKLATDLMYEAVRKGASDPNPRDVVGDDILAQLPPEKVKALETWRNPPFTSDNTIVPRIYDMWTNNTPALAGMRYSDLRSRYFSKLSEQDWNTVEGLWRQAQGVMASTGQTGTKAGQTPRDVYSTASYIDKVLADKGYIPADPKNRTENDRDRIARIGLVVGPMINSAEAEKMKAGKGRLSDLEKVELIDKALAASTVRQRVGGPLSRDKEISMAEALRSSSEGPIYVTKKDIKPNEQMSIDRGIAQQRPGFKPADTAKNRRIMEEMAGVIRMGLEKYLDPQEVNAKCTDLISQLEPAR